MLENNQLKLDIMADGKCNERLMVVNVDEKRAIKIGLSQLFDSKKYQKVQMVSFVSSPKLLFDCFKDFNDVELIIGIEDSEYQKSFMNGLMKNLFATGLDFFEQCPDEMKNRIAENQIRIYFSENGTVFHNKIYLLNSESSNRIIWGSSNLTQNGFGIGRLQYEDVSLSEDACLYNIFQERYKVLKEKSIDYIPEECKQIWREEERLPDLNEKAKILVDHIDKNREKLDVNTEDYKDLKEFARGENQSEKEMAERVIDIISQTTEKAKNKKRKIKSPEELKAPTVHVTRIAPKSVDSSNKEYRRTELIYQESTNKLYTFKPGYEEDKSITFGNQLPVDEIKKRVELINRLVSIYKSHSVDGKIENSKKAYEILLHAFMSPFMWKVRKDYMEAHQVSGSSIGGDIPNILVINGTAECGKSAMIAAINKMLQNGSYEIPQWKQYLKDDKWTLDKSVRENNIYPLIIDEVEKDFLGGGNCSYKGEAWIKSTANSLGKEEHPYIITATNKSIDLSTPLRRRVNYISFSSKIDRTMQSNARDIFSEIINASDTRLFEDFCGRVLEMIENDMSLYDSKRIKNGIKDPIAIARDIFESYYSIAGMELPEFFPTEPFDDYSTTGKQMWRDTFLDPNCKEAFIYQKLTNEIIVNTEKLSSKMYDRKSVKLIAYLNEYVKTDGNVAESSYLHLDVKKFFNWIEIDNPYERVGFFRRLLRN